MVRADDLALAAEWLEENEGEDDERLPLLRVAAWLRSEVRKRNEDQTVREVAKRSGASIQNSRKALRKALRKSAGI